MCSNYKVGRGSVIYVSETDPALTVLTASVAAVGDETITLTAAATETADLKAGSLWSFGDNLTIKVLADTTVTDAGVAVPVQPLDGAFAGTETSNVKAGFLLLGGLDQINVTSNRDEIEVTTLDDWSSKSYIPGLNANQVDLGDVKIIAGDAAQELLRKYHYQNIPNCLFFKVVGRNGMVFDFEGFTVGDQPINFTKDNPVMGSMSIRVSGAYATENVWD